MARLAGVSQSTVSRVFRDGASVTQATRDRVEAAARQVNYRPSRAARALTSNRSGMIAVIATKPSHRAHPEVLYDLGEEIQAAGHRQLVFVLPEDRVDVATVHDILSYNVDGLISCAVLDDDAIEACHAARVPVVLFNRESPAMPVASISCDHGAGLHALFARLAAYGTPEITYLAGPAKSFVSASRLTGVREAAAAAGFAIATVLQGDYSFDFGRKAMTELGGSGVVPRILLAANDAMALGAIEACRRDLGLRVPEDVAIVGYDDVPQASWPSFELTTLHQPVRDMAAAAVSMATARMDVPEFQSEVRRLGATLRLRGSA
ncbi:LacI family DNA-binding transcriptional regulator [Mesobacterium pallidum]|uniref:LacI family DNA-binding transcriptional regulator n=1 Tax=Mesobacterium pallidum TaxID=2872037 RepID=UPI001EE32696